ncbi:prephenate dehydratase [Longibacter salinarum]|uniref:Bifunctional chorismate mutase/prephenate dehydratase n=1 Tax=Longibacter salinarum TaxID=1850348 RepID=A0A2A8D132_9BACT|nr:prephenate dehydratase [Longibacter salinarum]PEN14669.1 prephenate dehydratase [Longibacter salinarum]
MTVAFQGELGAYSEEAVRRVYPDADLVPCTTFVDAFEAVADGAADRAVLPIENSLFGSVHVNYDHLRSYDVTIIGEVQVRIRHCLMAPDGATMDSIRCVRSHPQAIGQCRQSLRELTPEARTEPASDTAGAAREVAEQGDMSVAAIASRRAAERYGLTVVAERIEDNPQNYTRFLVLADADDDATPIGSDDAPFKTSIVFALRENVPGALFKSLAVFALRDLDLEKIESRPLVGAPGRYLFYLDVRGRASDRSLERAFDNLREVATDLRVLGSYRASQIESSDGPIK